MTKSLLLISLLTLSFSTFANYKGGGSVNHTLLCTTDKETVNTIKNLIITTAAVAPEFNIRAIAVSEKTLKPNVKPRVSSLRQLSQSAYDAIFVSVVDDVTVYFDKSTFQASLTIRDTNYLCK